MIIRDKSRTELKGILASRDAAFLNTDTRANSRAVAAGKLIKIRPGSFLSPDTWRSLSARDQHRLLILESSAFRDMVLCHRSAAILWDLPLLGAIPEKLEVIAPMRRGGTTRYIRRIGVKEPPPVTTHAGVRLTTAPRTVIDVARTEPFESGLVTVDAALASRLVTREELEAELEAVKGRKGYRNACLVVDYASDLSESPGESLSRARMIQLGAPIPELQVRFDSRQGLIGRVDFFWRQLGVVGEFDGAVKYEGTDHVKRQILRNERRREQEIREVVKNLIRWEWVHVMEIWPFANILKRAGILTGEPRLQRIKPLTQR